MRNITSLADVAREIGAGVTLHWDFADGHGVVYADATEVRIRRTGGAPVVFPYPLQTRQLWAAIEAVEKAVNG